MVDLRPTRLLVAPRVLLARAGVSESPGNSELRAA